MLLSVGYCYLKNLIYLEIFSITFTSKIISSVEKAWSNIKRFLKMVNFDDVIR